MLKEAKQREAMTQVQAARALGVTDRTLRRWDRKGLIHSERPAGGVRLYPIDAVQKLAKGTK
jgi:excisionase family DNA binding protein